MVILALFFIGFEASDSASFNLESALAYALENNPEIIQLTVEKDKADAGLGEARSAFYPQVSISGYYAYLSDISVFMLDSIAIPMGQHENYDVQVSMQQVIFAWGKIYNAYRIANMSHDITELQLIRKRQELKYSVATAFNGLLVLDEMASLMRESYSQLQRHEEAVKKRYTAGLAPQFEYLRAQVQVANFKPALIQTENGLKLAREGFKMLLGLPLDQEFVLTGDLEFKEESYQLDELTDIARENRAEIKILKRVEGISRIGRNIAATANLPSLVAGATYDRKKPFGFGGNDWGSNITFSIGFQLPLFAGFRNLYQYKATELKIKEARLAWQNLEKAIVLEVKQTYLNFLAAQEVLDAAQENVDQADKAFEIMETRYKGGLATNLEYMDAQLAAMQAKTNYLNSLKDYHTARAAIERAIGKED